MRAELFSWQKSFNVINWKTKMVTGESEAKRRHRKQKKAGCKSLEKCILSGAEKSLLHLFWGKGISSSIMCLLCKIQSSSGTLYFVIKIQTVSCVRLSVLDTCPPSSSSVPDRERLSQVDSGIQLRPHVPHRKFKFKTKREKVKWFAIKMKRWRCNSNYSGIVWTLSSERFGKVGSYIYLCLCIPFYCHHCTMAM